MSNNKVRVVHLVRSVGPTSMPWNDLYATARRITPGMMYPPAVIGFGWGNAKIRWIKCRDRRRRYISGNQICGFVYLWTLAKRSLSCSRTLVIHIHNPSLALLGLLVKLACPHIQIVGNLHSDWSFLKLRHKLGLNILARISQHFITVSNASMSSLPELLRKRMIKEGRLSVILNGIDSRQMGEYIPQSSGNIENISRFCPPGETVAIVVARMVPAKNCKFILRLLAATLAIDRLIWFGDGIQRKEVEAEIIRLGIKDKVELKGHRPRSEVFQVLASGTLYIAASRWEGIGVANIEATALGCYPFLSRIPAHEEIASLLDIPTYSLEDQSVWVNGIENFLSLPMNKKVQLCNDLASKTKSFFDLEVSVSKYILIYRKLVPKGYNHTSEAIS